MFAVTSPTLPTNTSPCQVVLVLPHVSCALDQTHTLTLYLALALFPHLEHRRAVMGVSLQVQWSMAEHVCLWSRDRCCCLLWQTACDGWSVATVTVCAVTQCLAKALCTAKFPPFPFLPAKACPTEVIHISLWYQFLTSLVMKSH